jgi:ribonuclease P protein component
VEVTPQKFSAATAPALRGARRSVSVLEPTPKSPGPIGRGKFPKAAHLLKHADFDRVYRTGRRQFSASITVFWLRREKQQEGDSFIDGTGPATSIGPRIGFTVGRVMGGSVVRNRIRRRLREAVRLNLAQLLVPSPQPVDVVINPKKSALAAEFIRLKSEVADAFRVIAQNLPATGNLPAKSPSRRPR